MPFPNFLKIAIAGMAIPGPNGTPYLIYSSPTDVKLAETITSAIGFSYKLVPSTEGFGSRMRSGNWTGMLGMLQNQEVDIVVSTVVVTEERNEDFLFTYPFTSAEVSFATRKHEYIADMAAVLHPFSTPVWLAVIICLSTMPFCFRALLSRKYSAIDLFMSVLGSVLQQGTNFQPKKLRDYLLLLFWFLGAGFVCYMYTAVLLSFITFPSLKGLRTIKDLSDGIRKGEYNCKAFRAFLVTELMRSKDPSLKIIGQSLQDTGLTPQFVAYLDDYKNDKKPAFIDQQMFLRQYEDFYFISDDVFFTMFPAITMRKDFCCKSEMDDVVHRFWGAGVWKKVISDGQFQVFLAVLHNLEVPEESPLRKLSLEEFKGIFAFLIASQILAFFVLLIEICIGKSKH